MVFRIVGQSHIVFGVNKDDAVCIVFQGTRVFEVVQLRLLGRCAFVGFPCPTGQAGNGDDGHLLFSGNPLEFQGDVGHLGFFVSGIVNGRGNGLEVIDKDQADALFTGVFLDFCANILGGEAGGTVNVNWGF